MIKWTVCLKSDIIKGQWNSQWQTMVYYEQFYIVATNRQKHYIHRFDLQDDWGKAHRLLTRIESSVDFSPENNLKFWQRIYDLKPIEHRKRRIYLK